MIYHTNFPGFKRGFLFVAFPVPRLPRGREDCLLLPDALELWPGEHVRVHGPPRVLPGGVGGHGRLLQQPEHQEGQAGGGAAPNSGTDSIL